MFFLLMLSHSVNVSGCLHTVFPGNVIALPGPKSQFPGLNRDSRFRPTAAYSVQALWGNYSSLDRMTFRILYIVPQLFSASSIPQFIFRILLTPVEL